VKSTLFSAGLFCLFLAIGFTPIISFAQSNGNVVLATTTSVRDAGLLDVLLRPYTEATGHVVKVIAVGSGHAMELGRRGEADILILHDPAAEEQFLHDGYGIDRVPLMHNEFVLVGPIANPADISGLDILDAFSKIAASRTRFLSRGDNSGTHAREQALWGRSNQTRDRAWYWETGQGMSSTLQIAAEVRAYTLSDIGTYLRHPASQGLEIMVSNDSLLFNLYHVMLVNPARFDGLNVEAARRLWDYLSSPSSRALIAEFGVAEFGRPLFYPDSAEVH
jgi:tungstate transport system substrate-binding protein